jgi:hypothetical protein
MNHLKQLKQLIISEVHAALREVETHEYEKLGTRSEKTGAKTLRVFDFDDTLAKTNSKVGITEFDNNTGEQIKPKYMITPAQYAKFKVEVADKHPDIKYDYDYSEFAQVVDPKIIDFTFGILRKAVKKMREDMGIPAVILTARGNAANENIRKFLGSLGVAIPVKTLNGSLPELKSQWIKQTMLDRDIPHVEFFDDSHLNVESVADLNKDEELISRFGKELRVRSRIVEAP